MESKSYTQLLTEFAGGVRNFVYHLPFFVDDNVLDPNTFDSPSFKVDIIQARTNLLVKLAFERRDYLMELIDVPVNQLIQNGKEFIEAASDRERWPIGYWLNLRIDLPTCRVIDQADDRRKILYPKKISHCILVLQEAVMSCDMLFDAINSELQSVVVTGGEEGKDYEKRLNVRLTDGQQQLLDVVKQVGHRLTKKEILNELSNRGEIASEGTTGVYLSVLTNASLLTNRQDVDPPGYGLPEWDRSI